MISIVRVSIRGNLCIKVRLVCWLYIPYTQIYWEANDQKFKRKDGDMANQLIKAIAVAVSNLVQWFSAHLLRSVPMRTMMPADAQAAANVRVYAIYIKRRSVLVSLCESKCKSIFGYEGNFWHPSLLASKGI